MPLVPTDPTGNPRRTWRSLLAVISLSILLLSGSAYALAGPSIGLYVAASLGVLLSGFAISCAVSWYLLRKLK